MLNTPCASIGSGWVQVLDSAFYWNVKPDRHSYMVTLAYFDESGTHGAESPLVTVAGFIATVEQWNRYERDLRDLFIDFDVKKFHAMDFRQRKGDFKG